MKCNVLILGASYGSLLGTKLLMAGHRVSLVCTRSTAELIRREGTRVRFPVRDRKAFLEISSTTLSGELSASTPDQVDPHEYDVVVLAMQEAQYGSGNVRDLMSRIAQARKPCLAIMNMPPLTYLERIPRLSTKPLEPCYANSELWKDFEPGLLTLASPDPQAFRPADERKNVLQVGLPTNFKAARFEFDAPTTLLQKLGADIEVARYSFGDQAIEIPVKLKVFESVFAPFAKWPMLIAGNYRCVQRDTMISINEAVHKNIDDSRNLYEWVCDLCIMLGAKPSDLVPFDKYASASASLGKPSSAARALFGGAEHIERVDSLVQRIGLQHGLHSEVLNEIVALVDNRLARNRAKSRQAQEIEAMS